MWGPQKLQIGEGGLDAKHKSYGGVKINLMGEGVDQNPVRGGVVSVFFSVYISIYKTNIGGHGFDKMM